MLSLIYEWCCKSKQNQNSKNNRTITVFKTRTRPKPRDQVMPYRLGLQGETKTIVTLGEFKATRCPKFNAIIKVQMNDV